MSANPTRECYLQRRHPQRELAFDSIVTQYVTQNRVQRY